MGNCKLSWLTTFSLILVGFIVNTQCIDRTEAAPCGMEPIGYYPNSWFGTRQYHQFPDRVPPPWNQRQIETAMVLYQKPGDCYQRGSKLYCAPTDKFYERAYWVKDLKGEKPDRLVVVFPKRDD